MLSFRLTRSWIELMTLLGTGVVLVLAVILAVQVSTSGRISSLGGWLEADALSAFVVLVVAFVSLTVALYSIGYLREDMRDQDLTQGEGLRQIRRGWPDWARLWRGSRCSPGPSLCGLRGTGFRGPRSPRRRCLCSCASAFGGDGTILQAD